MNSKLTTKVKVSLITGSSLLLLTMPAITHAAEINPPVDSYTYGSTSEFSPYSSLNQGSNPNPGGLAPTGQNTWLLYAIAILAIATPLTYFGIKKFKK